MSDLIGHFLTATKYGAILLATWLFSQCGYYLFLHPLKAFPGPTLAKVTDAYVGCYAMKQKLHHQTWKNHLKYGSIVRHGPERLIFNTVTALEDIYLNNSVFKSRAYDLTRQANGTSNIFNAIDKDLHRHKRRLVGYAISDRAMRAFEPSMAEQIDIFLNRLIESAQQPINATVYMKQLTIDIVALLGFGYHIQTQTSKRDRWLAEGVVKGNYRINCYINYPGLRHARIDKIMAFLAGKARLQYTELITRMIKERLSQSDDAKPDLFAAVTKEENLQGEKPLTQSDIFQEAVFFLPAGADTASATMCALLFYLSRHPDTYQRLSNEIRSEFKSATEITGGPKLSGCKYLRACIDEALRMSPPVGGTLWREQDPNGSLTVDGHVIPHGTQVGVCTYALHHNEKYFPDPFIFKPERWLTTDKNQAELQRRAFVPFSLGSRSCPGKAMAYLEMSLIIAKLIWHFDFKAAPGEDGEVGLLKTEIPGTSTVMEEYNMHDVFVSTHDGPYLRFQLREDK